MSSARFLISSVLCLCLISFAACAGRIVIPLESGPGHFVPLSASHETGSGEAVLELPGFTSYTSPGDPALPCRQVYVALPPDADPRTVSASLLNAILEELPGEYAVAPCPPLAADLGDRRLLDWGRGKQIVQGRNMLTYAKEAFYPAAHVQAQPVCRMRTWQLVPVLYWPYRYNPVSRKLVRAASVQLVVRYEQLSGTATAPPVIDPAETAFRRELSTLAVNYESARVWYEKASGSTPASVPRNVVGYVIITRSSIVNASNKLAAFVSHRQSQGYSVQVVTEETWGGGTGDTAAHNIRNWLAANYLSLGIQYVLLIGNPDPGGGDVPMKMLWPRHNQSDYQEAPSDYFYADLTGNWDLDGDGYYGEGDDDFGPGGVDRIPEVIVGRIPYYGSIADLDSILNKIIAYEVVHHGDWAKRVLLPMKDPDAYTQGYLLGEAIKNDIVVPAGFTYTRLYDQTYGLTPPPEVTPCTYGNVEAQWQQQAGFIVWFTHGGETLAVSVFTTGQCDSLDDTAPTFTFQASCLNGKPEYPYNLGYSLLRHGAIATDSASRVAWYYVGQTSFANTDSVQGLAYKYAGNLITQWQTCGVAHFGIKTGLPLFIWPNHCVFNLYGDPACKWVPPSGDLTPPSTPVVQSEVLSTETDHLHATWSSSDPETGVAEYEYSVGTGAGATDIVPWTRCGLATEVTVYASLAYGKVYYFNVRARNGDGFWSEAGHSPGTGIVELLGFEHARLQPNGVYVGIPCAVASANSNESGSVVYCQAEDRSCAIRVSAASISDALTEGDRIAVLGTTSVSGPERQLSDARVWKLRSGARPIPLTMANRTISGGDYGLYVKGATGAFGLNNTGLLVRTTGVVTRRDPTAFILYVDDGSRLWDGLGYTGVRVYTYANGQAITLPQVGQRVTVTGISSLQSRGSKVIRVLKIRRQGDIVVLM